MYSFVTYKDTVMTKNFNKDTDKLACHCCGEGDLGLGMYVLLQSIRDDLGKPVNVTSGARCWRNHKAIYEDLGLPPTKNSDHLIDDDDLAWGADINVSGMTPKELHTYLLSRSDADILAIGLYSWGCHLGLRGFAARW